MNAPWREVRPLPDEAMASLRRRAIFDCCKWDPQVEDTSTIAAFPLVLEPADWREISAAAEALAAETLAAEAELVERTDLHSMLALPRALRQALAHARGRPARGLARLIRFDFHHTRDGWRISEANTDVPGGLNEASGLARLMAPHYPGTASAGDVTGAYAAALAAARPGSRPASRAGVRVALAHATAYVDDRQVMEYLSRRLAGIGATAVLTSPSQLGWENGNAFVEDGVSRTPVDAIARFFPAEWLPNLPSRCGWKNFAGGATTPISNPASALLTQSKRFPLLWDSLRTPLPTWRALLPETRDPRDAPWRSSDDWVVKPALGRVGEDVGIPGLTSAKEWKSIIRSVRWHPGHWIAQRRFEPTVLGQGGEAFHPCVGVYTIGTRVAGGYGRLARRALIDYRAQDVAVLVAGDEAAPWAAPVHVDVERQVTWA